MRILTLSQWYDPEPNHKGHLLANELISRGHHVTAITGFPNYPAGKVYPGYRIRWWQWEQRDSVRVLRLPLYPDHSRSVVHRSFNYLSFAASASLLGPALCGPADVMWVYHPPLTVGIPAWWIGLLRRVPFVYEIQDMWPETVITSGMLSHGVAIQLLGRLAQFVYRQAAAISVISPGFKRNLMTKGVPEEKIHVIPNWADEEIYRPVPKDPMLGERYGLVDHFNVMFAGNMGPAQALDVVLQTASIVQDMPEVQFILIGDGIDLPDLKAETELQNLGNVRFIERQPATAMPRFFAWADALLVQLRNDSLFHMTIPSKTLAYLACGRPVLCGVPGDGAALVRQAGAGLIYQPEDPVSLAQAVRTFYAMAPAAREAMGQAGRQAFLQNYTRQVLVDQYEALFQEVVQRYKCTGE